MACWQVLTIGLAGCATAMFIYNFMTAEVAEDPGSCDIDDGCTAGCEPVGCVWFYLRTPEVNNCDLVRSFQTVSSAWRSCIITITTTIMFLCM